ncbi:type VI secretion system contractile sheath large subunit [Trinickia dinghuensis]|uniref:Type VI secretion system contractile sheath large subunit n=1 Tax=Trinickia dinghuensis TaxID=2291023 RepID=A0A3D8JQN0_9BURK|nr:type VI secretion system contractile sheath large subunit [Trinickia dinghuensis]RDU94741.1 type VI secretion system contractile sheath large subunit [Trinickia dinghuensis]
MSESVQKKLLRVRPPRVKITYDVETGGAIEKKELPFIVGILADLQGERKDPDTYPPLKERAMVEIDRDNFNDVMATIQPRVVLGAVKQTDDALKDLLKDDNDNELTFANIDAFEPMNVIKALPSLSALYLSRSQIRELQAKAEAHDPVSAQLDAMIEKANPGKEGAPAVDEASVTAAGTAIAPMVGMTPEQTTPLVTAFSTQLNLYFVESNADAAKQIEQARKRGAIAVIDELVSLIDEKLSVALSSIMHCDSFKAMESTWRGLHYLVMNTETSVMLKLRVFNATKDELRKDMMKAVEFDQSALFKMIYEAEYGTYGGNPYSLLIGDYAIGKSGEDVDFITKMAEIAAAAHAPFIAQASHDMFSLNGFDKLDKPRDLKKIFEGVDFAPWQAFREMEDARYVTLVLPRALLRLPYGSPTKRNTTPCEGINFDEHVGGGGSATVYSITGEPYSYPNPEPNHFLWGNPAYLLAERITNAFSLYSWTAAIRGVEGGGLVEGLPSYTYTSSNGSVELFCPTEVSITDRREKELNDLGFITLCHCKGTGKAAFFGGQTTNQPKKYFSDSANANAKISAMLPYMLAASRFAHYIKVIMREKIGSFMTRGNVETFLNSWISNYVLLDDNAPQEAKAAYPLREAKVVVTDVPGEPGAYRATVFLKPHFQLEELTTSIRLVANLPK